MKPRIIVLVLVMGCAGIFTAYGASQSEHQKAVSELEQTNKKIADASAELGGVKQKVASLTTSLAEQEKTILRLNDSVKATEASNAKLETRFAQLINPEQSTWDDADATFKSGDNVKALTTYKAFIRDFPLSSKIDLAQSKVKELEQLLASQAKEEARQKLAEANAAAQAARIGAVREQSQLTRSKFSYGMYTYEDLSRILVGRTEEEVLLMLGDSAESLMSTLRTIKGITAADEARQAAQIANVERTSPRQVSGEDKSKKFTYNRAILDTRSGRHNGIFTVYFSPATGLVSRCDFLDMDNLR